MSSEAETIYERVAKLEDEIALLRSEVDILNVTDKKVHSVSRLCAGKDCLFTKLLIIAASLTTNEFIYRLILGILMRGSPSLVGRGIANPMSAMTRGFKSLSPRH